MTRPDPYELGRQSVRRVAREQGLPDELDDPAVIARLVALFAGAVKGHGPGGAGAGDDRDRGMAKEHHHAG